MNRRYDALKVSGSIIGIYLLQLLFPAVTEQFAFTAAEFTSHPWQIVTSIFLHAPGDYMHLLNNLFFLAVFGTLLELYIGSNPFLKLFLTTGIVANLAAFTFYPSTPAIGASGAISGIVACLAVIKPRKVGLFWGVPVPMWVALIGWIVTNLAGVGAAAGIAFEAHLYGLAAGGIAGVYYRSKHDNDDDSVEDVSIDETTIRGWEEQYLET